MVRPRTSRGSRREGSNLRSVRQNDILTFPRRREHSSDGDSESSDSDSTRLPNRRLRSQQTLSQLRLGTRSNQQQQGTSSSTRLRTGSQRQTSSQPRLRTRSQITGLGRNVESFPAESTEQARRYSNRIESFPAEESPRQRQTSSQPRLRTRSQITGLGRNVESFPAESTEQARRYSNRIESFPAEESPRQRQTSSQPRLRTRSQISGLGRNIESFPAESTEQARRYSNRIESFSADESLRERQTSSQPRLRTRSQARRSSNRIESFPAEESPRQGRNNVYSDDSDNNVSSFTSTTVRRLQSSDDSESSFGNYFDSFSDDSAEQDGRSLRIRNRRSKRLRASRACVRRRNRSRIHIDAVIPLKFRLSNSCSWVKQFQGPRRFKRVRDRSLTPGPSREMRLLANGSYAAADEDASRVPPPRVMQPSRVWAMQPSALSQAMLPSILRVPSSSYMREPENSDNSIEYKSNSVQLDDFSDSTNSDDESEKCPICLRKFIEQEVGVPGCCEHNFCGACIAKWAEDSTTCPIDRRTFTTITILRKYGGVPLRIINPVVRAPR